MTAIPSTCAAFSVPVEVFACWQHFRTRYSQWSQRCTEAVRLSPISVNRLNGGSWPDDDRLRLLSSDQRRHPDATAGCDEFGAH